MLIFNSLLSFFSFSVSKEAMQRVPRSLVDETNENNEKWQCRNLGLFSVTSCNSFISLFVSPQDRAGAIVQNHALRGQFLSVLALLFSGTISESQHTGCTHRVLPALAGGVAPTTPKRPKP